MTSFSFIIIAVYVYAYTYTHVWINTMHGIHLSLISISICLRLTIWNWITGWSLGPGEDDSPSQWLLIAVTLHAHVDPHGFPHSC